MLVTFLIVLQALQVACLWLHDWVPLGRLNNVAAIRGENTVAALVVTTIVQSLPFSIGLAASLAHLRTGFPPWLLTWLWASYGVLFAGELRAWWVPYLLPERHGIVPNTLHTLLHAATLGTLLVLAVV